jgi:N-acetylneuraminate synthase
MNDRVFIIAEAGVNHNGSVDRARQLIDAAVDAGADAVKFQTFSAAELVRKDAPKAGYQLAATGHEASQFEMLKQLELNAAAHQELWRHCERRSIEFLSTPFDPASLAMLLELGVKRIKLSSGEITNGPLLFAAALSGLPIILSTGMATLEEVAGALGVLTFGYRKQTPPPEASVFWEAMGTPDGSASLAGRVTLLHCTTEYPAPLEEVNLRAMNTLQETFGLACGVSDHSEGIVVPMAAVARGATVIEKHFTLDKCLPGPDHRASLNPDELKAMVAGIRQVERTLGSAEKRATASEQRNLAVVRRSLVAKKPIRRGDLFSVENLGFKRPGDGVSPMRYWEWLGRTADRDYQMDETICPTDYR